jgi:hypothetical protein
MLHFSCNLFGWYRTWSDCISQLPLQCQQANTSRGNIKNHQGENEEPNSQDDPETDRVSNGTNPDNTVITQAEINVLYKKLNAQCSRSWYTTWTICFQFFILSNAEQATYLSRTSCRCIVESKPRVRISKERCPWYSPSAFRSTLVEPSTLILKWGSNLAFLVLKLHYSITVTGTHRHNKNRMRHTSMIITKNVQNNSTFVRKAQSWMYRTNYIYEQPLLYQFWLVAWTIKRKQGNGVQGMLAKHRLNFSRRYTKYKRATWAQA